MTAIIRHTLAQLQAASIGGLIEASFQGVDAINDELVNALGVYSVDLQALKALRPDVIVTQLQVRTLKPRVCNASTRHFQGWKGTRFLGL